MATSLPSVTSASRARTPLDGLDNLEMLPYVRVTLHATRLGDSAMEQQAIDTARINIRANIDSNSEFDAAYIIMNGLAAVVACYGLFENSPAVVIGAMIIAMLLGPIAGVSLGVSGELLRGTDFYR
jgi:hypothetical protein